MSTMPQAAFSQSGDSAALPVWTKYWVDSPPYFTNMSDRSLDYHTAGGFPCIAYGGDALYFSCYSPVTEEWWTSIIDPSTQVGEYAALRFDNFSRPFITYYDSLNAVLKMAWSDWTAWYFLTVPNVDGLTLSDPAVSQGETGTALDANPPQPVDPRFLELAQQVQVDPESIAPPIESVSRILSNDEPVVDESPVQQVDESEPTILERIEAAVQPIIDEVAAPTFPFFSEGYGKYSSIAFDRSNGIHITYHDEVDGSLEYLYWNGSVWNGKVVDDHDDQGDEGLWTSVEVDFHFNVHVGYMSDKYDDLRYAKRNATGGWTLTTVDGDAPGNGTDVGAFASLALDSDYYPHISYNDFTNGRLKHAWKDDDGWHDEGVDNTGLTGWFTSIAIDNNDRIHVSYYSATKGDLRYARKDGGWSLRTLDEGKEMNTGLFTSIAVDNNNRPGIAYLHAGNGSLRYIHSNRTSGWGNSTVVQAAARDVGLATSLAISNTGVPFISYLDATSGSLKLARTYGLAWNTQTLIADPHSGLYSSIDLLNGSVPRIAYYNQENGNLMYAQDLGASTWLFSSLDRTRDVGRYASLELDSLNIPHVSYYDASNQDLLYTSYDASASGWYTDTIDFEDSVGWYTSITVNSARLPFISYYDQTTGSLMLAFRSPITLSWVKWVVDNIGFLQQTGVGAYTSIDLDNLGRPHISYYDVTNKMLKYAYWEGTWTGTPAGGSWNISVVDPSQDTGRFSSLVIDPVGNISHICYYDLTNGNLKYAQGTIGVAWQRQVVDGSIADGDPFNEGDVGYYCSIDLNPDGMPGISYYSNSHADLKFASSYTLPSTGTMYLPLMLNP